MGNREPPPGRDVGVASHAGPGDERVRLDKWLWAARFFKTRALAAKAIDAGKIELGGERTKPAKTVRVGDSICIRRASLAWEVRVTALSDRRGNAGQAALLYSETPQSAAAREAEIARLRTARAEAPSGRPTKRERRRLEDFLAEP